MFCFASTFQGNSMLRIISLSTAAVAALFVTSVANAQSGSRSAVPSVPSFSAPVQSAPVVSGSGTSFGARQTFSQPTPSFSQPAPVANGSGTVIRSTSPSPFATNPPVSYAQPQVISSSCGCPSSAPVIQPAPVSYSAPVIRYFPPVRRSCGCGGW